MVIFHSYVKSAEGIFGGVWSIFFLLRDWADGRFAAWALGQEVRSHRTRPRRGEEDCAIGIKL